MPETLLLLGGSSDQTFAIKTAKAMGIRTLVVDMNENSPGFALADDYAVVSTRDIPALKTFVDDYQKRQTKISGVLVMGSDIPDVVAALASHLRVPGVSSDTARVTTHKLLMKQRLQAKNIPIPWFKSLASVDELKAIVKQRGFPLVIKPVDRSGARGVFRLTADDDLDVLFRQSLAESFSGEVMVEEYLDGLQISTETLMYKGRAYTPGFADRNYEMLQRFAPAIIENGGWMPTSVTPTQRQSIEHLVEKTALALGVSDGIVKGDVVLTTEGPRIIEMAARLSGGDFSESLIPLSTGVNLVREAIHLALGREPNLEALKPKNLDVVVNRYFFPKPGRLVGISGDDEVRSKPWIKKLSFFYRPGDQVPQVRCHGDRFGVFIATAKDRQEAEERMRWVLETIKIVTV